MKRKILTALLSLLVIFGVSGCFRRRLVPLEIDTTTVITSHESVDLSSIGVDDIDGPYMVDYVIDGDTIIVRIEDEKVHVRLIGIDAPESASKDEELNTEYGEMASEYLKELLEGKEVYLEYDVELKDKYDRTLAYVYFLDDDGNVKMANMVMVEEGLAWTMPYEPNIKYKDAFERAYFDAEDARQIPDKASN